ncbi:MAG TPA: hypothetical protein VGW12_07840 [Pyrinomonadaceae bacterium]|nr:hypothetical protein [Pyrinomonadaceae bacterium]
MISEAKNPFPNKSVVSVAGASEQKLRTLPTLEFIKSAELACRYITEGIGQVITISGSHGSGKTHLVYYMMEAVHDYSSKRNNATRYVQIYAKTESADFIALYRQIVSQIGYSLLREVNSRFLGFIATEELHKQNEDKEMLLTLISEDRKEDVQSIFEESKLQTEEHFDADPETVYTYLDSLVLQPEAILDRRAAELNSIAGENFKKAFFYLDSIDLGKTAYKWFVMDDMTETELRQIGVSGPLNTADEARSALRLLVTLFRYSKIRLLMYIDQVERLLFGTDSKISEVNAGYLHSLAEFFPREKAFLALAGSDEGWNLLRKDFWGRIGPTGIVLQQISIKESRELINVYVSNRTNDTTYTDSIQIAPFTLDAVDEILKLRGGNRRRFLQTCHDAYQKYLDDGHLAIDSKLIRQVVTDEKAYFDHQKVVDDITLSIRKKNLQFDKQVNLTPLYKPDILIGEETDPIAVVEISDALFYVEEARRALDIILFSAELVRKFPRTKLITIIIGYVSSEVFNQLNGVVDYCLVYEGEEFRGKFELILDSILSEHRQVNTHEVDQHLRLELIDSVRNSFGELINSREEELKKLSARLDRLILEQSRERERSFNSQQQQEWQNWLKQDQERWEERQIELKQRAENEHVRQQERGENLQSKERQTLLTRFVVLSSINAALLYVALSTFDEKLIFETKGVLSLIGGAVFSLYILFLTRPSLLLSLSSRESEHLTSDLNQIVLQAKTNPVPLIKARRYLKSMNPASRYYGAQIFLAARDQNDFIKKVDWLTLAIGEPWLPLYLTYFKLGIKTENAFALKQHLELLVEANPDDPRVIYAISLLSPSNPEDSTPVSKELIEVFKDSVIIKFQIYNDRYIRVVAHGVFEHLFDITFIRDSFRDRGIHPLIMFAAELGRIFGHDEPLYSPMYDLAKLFVYEGRFSESGIHEVREIPMSKDELRQTINILSPHRESGLASFYDLSISSMYLRLYRFFAEIEWRAERVDISFKNSL